MATTEHEVRKRRAKREAAGSSHLKAAPMPTGTPRIERLRQQYFTHRPSVCVERAVAYT